MGLGWVFVVVFTASVLQVKRPFSTEQPKDHEQPNDEVTEQDASNKPDTATSKIIR